MALPDNTIFLNSIEELLYNYPKIYLKIKSDAEYMTNYNRFLLEDFQ